MENLTAAEIDILMEGLDEWVSKGLMGNMMGSLLGAMMCGKDEGAKGEMKAKQDIENAEFEVGKRLRKEQVIMLKAKLLKIRDGIEAASI